MVDGSNGNTLLVLPQLLVDKPSSFYQIVDSQLSQPLTEWASGDKQVCSRSRNASRHVQGGMRSNASLHVQLTRRGLKGE